jgi:rRNA maturation RNase YbeY
MRETNIHFFKEDVSFRFSGKAMTEQWLLLMIRKSGWKISNLNFIFCSDKYLLKINKEYLQHDYFTDIVTFDNSELKKTIEGDVFISVDRVKSNAKFFDTGFSDELRRVMAHGVLHLLGFGDKTEKEKEKMRNMENLWLKEF